MLDSEGFYYRVGYKQTLGASINFLRYDIGGGVLASDVTNLFFTKNKISLENILNLKKGKFYAKIYANRIIIYG